MPGGEIMKQLFAASSDPNYREISQRLVIAKDSYEYFDMVRNLLSTGMFAQIGTFPYTREENFKYWYRSSETIGGTNPYVFHLANKKFALKKVL